MYYEEKVINGILCFRNDPHGEWNEIDYAHLLSAYEQNTKNYYAYAKLAQEHKVSRDAWKKLAVNLMDIIDNSKVYCCDKHAKTGLHIPDCPIEQLRELKEGEG